MSAARYLMSGEEPEPRSTSVPVMTLEELSEVRRVLEQHDEAYAALSRHRQALRAWDGPSLTSMRLEILLAAELPPAVAAGMAAREEVQALNRHQGPEPGDRLIEQQMLTARLHALTTEQQQEQADAQARIQALEHLRPLADQILATRAHLARLLARQGEQRGRGLAGLWGALSGQAAALQREIDQARHAEEEGLTAYSLRAASLGLRLAPSPAELGTRLAEDKRSLAERMQQADAGRQAFEVRLRELDVWLRDTQGRLAAAETRAAETWAKAQRLHKVPDWPVWEDIWQQREEVRLLWRAGAEARQLLQEATRSLERLCSGWPSDLRGVEALRRILPHIEEAALARQAREAEAKRRVEERNHRTTLLVALHGRLTTLAAEGRAREERRQAKQATAERRQARQAQAEQRYLEEARRARKAEAARTPFTEVGLPAPPVTSRPRPHTDSGERPLPDAARRDSASPISFPVLERHQLEAARLLLVRHVAAAGQAAMCQEALEEWAEPELDALKLAALMSRPLSPVLEQVLADWTQLARQGSSSQEVQDRRNLERELATVVHLIEQERNWSVRRRGTLRQHLDVRRRQQSAKTLASDFRLALSPDELRVRIEEEEQRLRTKLQPLQQERQRVQQALLDLGGTRTQDADQHARLALRCETTWTELRRTLGVPAQPDDWNRLWASRAKVQTLWSQWEQAQQRMREQEAQMISLWAGWPSAEQNAEALRRAVETAEAGATPSVLPTSITQPSGHTVPRPVPFASPVLPPPLPSVGNAPTHRTPTVERPTASRVLSPALPGQAAASRPADSPVPSQPVGTRPMAPLPSITLAQPGPAPATPSPGIAVPDPEAECLSSSLHSSAARFTVEAAPASVSSLPLLPAQVAEARSLIQRYDAVAAQVALCRKALDSWAGRGLDGLRLGELVSQPLPPEIGVSSFAG
jgi:hypothetical protein